MSTIVLHIVLGVGLKKNKFEVRCRACNKEFVLSTFDGNIKSIKNCPGCGREVSAYYNIDGNIEYPDE